MNIEKDPKILVAPLDQLNFLHEAKQYIDKNLTSTQAYYLMTSKPPVWLRAAFKLRDFLSRHLGGVQPIQGFGESTKPLQVGGKADFFDVVKVSDRELFLQSIDKHLSVLLVLQIEEYDGLRNELTICTSVVTYNLFGKIYMLPVSMVHGFIVQQSLKNLQIKS